MQQQPSSLNAPMVESNDTINLRAELEKYLVHWKWFVLGVFLALFGAYTYLRYVTPQYSASTTILVKDDKKGGASAELAAFQDLGILGGATNNIDNEIEIIKSRKIIGDVIKKLQLNWAYYTQGRVIQSELYVNPPIRLYILNLSDDIYKKDTMLTVKENDLNSFSFVDVDGNLSKEYSYGESISASFGEFTIRKSFPQTKLIKGEVIITLRPLNKIIDSYKAKLNIAPLSKRSSVISLSIQDPVKQKAEDFLNQLVQLYNDDAVKDKKQVSEKTKTFIDERLAIIGQDLANVNNNLKDFQQQNKLTDIKLEGQLILQNVAEINKKIAENSIQLRLVESLSTDLSSQKNDDSILASNIGAEDASIAKSISEYNYLILQRDRLLKTASTQNPQVINVVAQIKAIKEGLQKSLQTTQSSLSLTLDQLQSQKQIIQSKISGIPSQALALGDIKLQQEIVAGLYSYLLKKKEETDISLAVTVPNAKIIDTAYGSNIPVSPKRKIVYLAALLLGLLVPFIVIYLVYLLDTKVHTKKQLQEVLSVPVLGDVPRAKNNEKIVIDREARSSSAEAFRLIRTNLDFMLMHQKDQAKTIFVTSTTSGEGKSFISINTAASLALSGKKVLLIGMDLRAPKVTEYLGLPDRKGVTNYITDQNLSFQELLFQLDAYKNLDIMSSGAVPPNPAELLMTERVDELFSQVKSTYDYIVVDTAPVNLVTDTLLISKYADMFMYVVRANYLDKRLLSVPQTLYTDKRLPHMAMVLNDTNSTKGYGYGYGYGYGSYGYGYVEKPKTWYQKLFDRS